MSFLFDGIYNAGGDKAATVIRDEIAKFINKSNKGKKVVNPRIVNIALGAGFLIHYNDDRLNKSDEAAKQRLLDTGKRLIREIMNNLYSSEDFYADLPYKTKYLVKMHYQDDFVRGLFLLPSDYLTEAIKWEIEHYRQMPKKALYRILDMGSGLYRVSKSVGEALPPSSYEPIINDISSSRDASLVRPLMHFASLSAIQYWDDPVERKIYLDMVRKAEERLKAGRNYGPANPFAYSMLEDIVKVFYELPINKLDITLEGMSEIMGIAEQSHQEMDVGGIDAFYDTVSDKLIDKFYRIRDKFRKDGLYADDSSLEKNNAEEEAMKDKLRKFISDANNPRLVQSLAKKLIGPEYNKEIAALSLLPKDIYHNIKMSTLLSEAEAEIGAVPVHVISSLRQILVDDSEEDEAFHDKEDDWDFDEEQFIKREIGTRERRYAHRIVKVLRPIIEVAVRGDVESEQDDNGDSDNAGRIARAYLYRLNRALPSLMAAVTDYLKKTEYRDKDFVLSFDTAPSEEDTNKMQEMIEMANESDYRRKYDYMRQSMCLPLF